MRHGLAKRAIHRIVVGGRLAMRMVEDFGDCSRRGIMDMGLSDIGLQRKGDQDQASDKPPARAPFPDQYGICLHLA